MERLNQMQVSGRAPLYPADFLADAPKRQTQVDAALVRLAKEVSVLRDVASELHGRLSAVLGNDFPPTGGKEEPKPPVCGLANAIDSETIQIEMIKETLQNALRRLEI